MKESNKSNNKKEMRSKREKNEFFDAVLDERASLGLEREAKEALIPHDPHRAI